MASQIDPTVIVDDQKVDKADLRTQFQIAADEITALQNTIFLPRQMALDDHFWDEL